MGKKLIYLFNLFLSHIQKYFFEITERTKLDYFKNFVTRIPYPAKLHTMFKASGLKRNPVQDAQDSGP